MWCDSYFKPCERKLKGSGLSCIRSNFSPLIQPLLRQFLGRLCIPSRLCDTSGNGEVTNFKYKHHCKIETDTCLYLKFVFSTQ
ncbi:hypothetical protein ZEAMMB73_Zm00001d050505 [Zea mays]|uniref:Uncharacterized protein n=1 Tax=Zea mays TaxID=4577 RepID=A0A1D6Q1Y7_MAIZE|nr:hypothetical protein ZEAMMB73_Zm00001d050505 [Zea mays]AQK52628.1 hypothetical protein ZEAMMB73_Zm00001d050505 [Zea mays]